MYFGVLVNNKCIIDSGENFVRRSIRNHCNIYTSNGKLKLSIPVKKNTDKKITKIKICYNENWQKKHWNSIITNYNSSPFFKYYKNELYDCFIEKETYLFSFTQKINNKILKFLNYKNNVLKTPIYEKKGEFIDLRNFSWDSISLKKYDQVFYNKSAFINNLSIIDLIFNLGPESQNYLKNINKTAHINDIGIIS